MTTSVRALVVYGSQWGNTEAIARAVAEALGPTARAERAADLSAAALLRLDLLIVGSPTQGGRPLPAVTKLLASVDRGALTGARVAAFDTRIKASERGFALRLLMRAIGYAAPRLAKALTAKGGRLAAPPAGFFVEGKEGPLKPGERERAAAWARALLAVAQP
ncbi:MAG: flavodoxin family protein [Dehalococcoidia bacterium]